MEGTIITHNAKTMTAPTASAASEPLRIAIVDDATDLANMLAMVLDGEGMDTRTACNGAEALVLVQSFKPHCVLFDICMPGMDGLALARHMRASVGDDVVLLAMTALDPSELRVADTFELVDHYFRKPFEMSELLKVLKPGRR